MRRPTRPFTVEIRSSRKPLQKASPALTGLPRTAAPPPNLWSGEVQDTARERSPASLTAFKEANRLFAKLTAPTPASVPAQRSDALSSEASGGQGDRREMTAEAAPLSPPHGQDAGRPGSVLPDLSVSALEVGAPPHDTDQGSAPRNRRPRRKASKEAQTGCPPEEQFAPDQDSTHPSAPVLTTISRPDQPETVSVEQPAARASTPMVRSSRQPRSLRALDQSWVYRATLRKAKRRGEPLPLRTAWQDKGR